MFFRDSVRREAERLGLAGWVTNRADGAVEGAVEGEHDAVERMTAFWRAGPGESQVDSLEVAEEDPEGLSSFEIR